MGSIEENLPLLQSYFIRIQDISYITAGWNQRLANVVNIFQAVRNYGNQFTSSYEEYNQELQTLRKDLFRANKIVLDLVGKMLIKLLKIKYK